MYHLYRLSLASSTVCHSPPPPSVARLLHLHQLHSAAQCSYRTSGMDTRHLYNPAGRTISLPGSKVNGTTCARAWLSFSVIHRASSCIEWRCVGWRNVSKTREGSKTWMVSCLSGEINNTLRHLISLLTKFWVLYCATRYDRLIFDVWRAYEVFSSSLSVISCKENNQLQHGPGHACALVV